MDGKSNKHSTSVYRTNLRMSNICWAFAGHRYTAQRTFIENILNIPRTSNDHVSNISRTSVELASNIRGASSGVGPVPNTYHPSQFRAQRLWVNNPSHFRPFVGNRGRVFRYFYLSRSTTWVDNPHNGNACTNRSGQMRAIVGYTFRRPGAVAQPFEDRGRQLPVLHHRLAMDNP